MAIYPPYKVRKTISLTEYQSGEIRLIDFPVVNASLNLDLTEIQTGDVLKTVLLDFSVTETQTGEVDVFNTQLLDTTQTQTGDINTIDNLVTSLDLTETQTGIVTESTLLAGFNVTETQTGDLSVQDVVITNLDTTETQTGDITIGNITTSLDVTQTQTGDVTIPTPDTDYTTYANRVAADGGTIADATHTESLIVLFKAQSVWTDLVAGYSASGGYRTVSGNVDVLYNFKGSTGDAIQTTSSARPAYQATGGANSKPAISFNGHQLSTSLVTPSSINHTIICVWQHGTGNTGYRGIWATSGMMLLASDNGAWGTYGTTDRPASTTLVSGNNYILEMARATGTGQFYLNGSADGTYADTTGQSPSHFGGILGQESIGKVMALFAFNIELNSTQLSAIRSALNSYYSIY